MTNPTPTSGRVRALTALALFALCLFHFLRLTAFFGGGDAVLSDDPLIHQDHGWHYYYIVNGSRFLAETGTTSGYDPHLMAGYPTDVFDSSDRLLKVLFALIPFHSPAAGYKIVVFISGAIFPLIFFLAARLWGLPRLDSIFATICGIWIWWEDLGASFFDVGMTGFLMASFFAFLATGFLAAYLRKPGPARAAGLTVGLALSLLVHPGVVLILVAPVLALLFHYREKITVRTGTVLFATGVVALALNLFWVLPLFINLRFAHGSATHFQAPILFIGIYGSMLKQGHLSYLVVGIGGYLGLRQWRRSDNRGLYPAFIATIAAMLFIVFFGFLLPVLKSSQPVRYGMPLMFAPCFAGGCWLAFQARRLLTEGEKSRLWPGLILALVGVTALVSALRPARDPQAAPFVGVGPDVALVRDWINRETDGISRVLVEEQVVETDIFYQTVPLAYLALATGREIVGGPHWATFLLQHRVDFAGKMLLGRNIRLLEGQDLSNLLQAYNIGWVVARTPETTVRFDRFSEVLIPMGEKDGFHFYRCPKWPQGFFLQGSGRARANFNRISVNADVTRLGKVVLSYHWHPCLTVDPPRRIFRAEVDDDPVGFVGIEGESGSYEVRMRYPIFGSDEK